MTTAPHQPISRNGRFATVRSIWDHNGSFHVSIADLVHDADIDPPRTHAQHRYAQEAARCTARRIDTMDQVQWTRLNEIRTTEIDGALRNVYSFTVSRLSPLHR